MSSLLPPPPPRHPSHRRTPSTASSSPLPPSPASTSSSTPLKPAPTLAQPRTPDHSTLQLTQALAIETAASISLPAPPPPPLHPSHPFLPPSPAHPSTPISPPRHHTLPPPSTLPIGEASIQKRLEQLEDQEVLDLLDRVGGQLTELTVERDDDEEGGRAWPRKEDFVVLGEGQEARVDWLAYGIACLLAALPPALVPPHPPPASFSLRQTLSSLERLYVLLPPVFLSSFFLSTLPSLYRWHSPPLTLSLALLYALLWIWDLLPALPVAVLVFALAKARLVPPSAAERLAEAEERNERTKEAKELGRQVRGSGRFGIVAGEGVRGLWSEVKERVGRGGQDDDEGETKSLAAALGGGGAFFGGGVGGMPVSSSSTGVASSLRQRSASTASAAPPTTATGDDDPPVATAKSASSQKSEDVSLYRLARTLSASFGPHIQLWLEELVEAGEGVKNALAHPAHPSSLTFLFSLSLILSFLVLCPAYLLLKLLWAYLGLEFFVLWGAREKWPVYRRALSPWWWILYPLPSDAEYALWVLRKRGEEGKTLKGSRTLKRAARNEGESGLVGSGQRPHRLSLSAIPLPGPLSSLTSSLSTPVSAVSSIFSSNPSSASASGFSSRDRGNAASVVSMRSTTTAGEREEKEVALGAYFALHSSTPGQLHLTSHALLFRPTRGLRTASKLVHRLSSPSPSSSNLAVMDDGASVSSGVSASTAGGGGGKVEEMRIKIAEVKAVKKEQKLMGAVEGIVVVTKGGEVYRFDSVVKRDECFVKLLSAAKGRWETTG